MSGNIIEATKISGLHWEENTYENDKYSIFYKVSSSEGPGVSDIVTHEKGFTYHHYGIHIGQIDRLTFFGNSNQVITGHFIDCRRGSPTLHHKVELNFLPTPTRKLIIDRGIAHTFVNIESVVTRDEPIWLLTEHNPAYNLGNDVLNFSYDASPEDFPTVEVNTLPIPDVCYDYVLANQHQNYRKATPIYGMRYKVLVEGVEKYVIVKQKSWKKPVNHTNPGNKLSMPEGFHWVNSYYASSGGDSYYIVESPVVRNVVFLTPKEISFSNMSEWIENSSTVLLTFMGDPEAYIYYEINFSQSNFEHQETFCHTINPDPLYSLHLPKKTRIRFKISNFIVIRLEYLEAEVLPFSHTLNMVSNS